MKERIINEIIRVEGGYVNDPRDSGGVAGADKVNVYYRENTVEDYSSQDMFNSFDQADFGGKMYLELIDNRVLNAASISRIHGALAGFELDQFKIANNTA